MASVALVRWPPDVDEPVVLDYGGVPFHATVTKRTPTTMQVRYTRSAAPPRFPFGPQLGRKPL